MEEHTPQQINKFLLFAALAILLILSYKITQPFFLALIYAFILAYLIKPVYKQFVPKIGESFAAIVSIIIIILVIIIPIALVGARLTHEILESLDSEIIKKFLEILLQLPLINQLKTDPQVLIQSIRPFLFPFVTAIVTRISAILITLFITIISTFYILKAWDTLSEKLIAHIPFKNKKEISQEIAQATSNIVYGYALVACIEFVIALIGFYISGVKLFALLPFLIAIFAFLPGLGPAVVWAPLALYHLSIHNYFTAVGVIVTGLIISIGIDNVLAPKIVGTKSKIHPLIMLIGVLGGISLFGLFGFIIGPLILVYTLKLIEEAVKQS